MRSHSHEHEICCATLDPNGPPSTLTSRTRPIADFHQTWTRGTSLRPVAQCRPPIRRSFPARRDAHQVNGGTFQHAHRLALVEAVDLASGRSVISCC